MATLTTFSLGTRVSYGTSTVSGGASTGTDIDTGLNTIVNAQATVKDTDQAAGNGGYCTVDYDGTDGYLDIYVWDDAGAAAGSDTVVDWIAIGT